MRKIFKIFNLNFYSYSKDINGNLRFQVGRTLTGRELIWDQFIRHYE